MVPGEFKGISRQKRATEQQASPAYNPQSPHRLCDAVLDYFGPSLGSRVALA